MSPQLTRDLGRVVNSSPSGVRDGRKRVLVHFELEGTHLVTTNFVLVKFLRDMVNSRGMGRCVPQIHFPLTPKVVVVLSKPKSVTT